MFSNNQKISVRQLKRLLVMDWIGKISLLLPRFIVQSSGKDLILSLILGVGITAVYTCIVCYLSRYITRSFGGYVELRLGRASAFALCLVYWSYMFVNLLYITRVFGAVTRQYMLPELSENIPCILMLLGGFYASMDPKERRGRIAEVLYPFVLIPLLILLVIASFGVQSEYFTYESANFNAVTMKQSFQVFTAFGGVSLILFEAPFIQKSGMRLRTTLKGLMITAIGIGAAILIGIGSFGDQGMKALRWPVVTLMSNVDIPGGFLQRFDILFLALLLMSFFVAASTGIFYLNLIFKEMFKQPEEKHYHFLMLILSIASVLWCKNVEIAQQLFLTVNCYLLIPIMAVFTVIFAILEWEKRRRSK
ncbi:GerAB/ArcD/ProY family transporter [Robinsoniella peoriensis]|uniref:GerAB/ArcD/ProY family transporter n=1 Tax=Robinsoniella peoriensis TaxID=180332 RepID=UPI00374FEEA2